MQSGGFGCLQSLCRLLRLSETYAEMGPSANGAAVPTAARSFGLPLPNIPATLAFEIFEVALQSKQALSLNILHDLQLFAKPNYAHFFFTENALRFRGKLMVAVFLFVSE